MIAELASTRSSLKTLILRSGSSLGMQMLSQVVLRRLYRVYNIRSTSASSALEANLAMGHVEVINVVLLVVVLLPVVLILEYFGKDAFTVGIYLVVSLN